jgi:hypothetical protein
MILRRLHSSLLLCACLASGLSASAPAEPVKSRGNGIELSARYSHSANSALTAPTSAGKVSMDSFHLALKTGTPVSETTRLLYGLDWTRHELALTETHSLPGTLKSLSLPLGVSHRFDERWQLLALASPQIAGADGSVSTAGFALPLTALAQYTASPTLTWSFGLRYSSRSDISLLPLVGVSWNFAPDWKFELGWPESGLSYKVTPRLTLRANATVQGGAYLLDGDPRLANARTGALARAWLDYRELRAGVAASYMLTPAFSLRVDAGRVLDQRFEYIQRALTLKGSHPAYVALSASGRF